MSGIDDAEEFSVERLREKLDEDDLNELYLATVEAIKDGNGFGWLDEPPRGVLEAYWRGVALMPEREVWVAWLNGHIVGSIQLLHPSRHNQAQAHIARLTTFFIAPHARGRGLAKKLFLSAEESARAAGFRQLDLDVRETQQVAIQMYEQTGYVRWAEREDYAIVDDIPVRGFYYTKSLQDG